MLCVGWKAIGKFVLKSSHGSIALCSCRTAGLSTRSQELLKIAQLATTRRIVQSLENLG